MSTQGGHLARRLIGRRGFVSAALLAVSAVLPLAAQANAVPAPEIEYIYNVSGRRHYNFPNNDPLGYGHAICDEIGQGRSYADVMADTKRDVTPNDEFATNFLISNAVNILCPQQIWRLRNSASGYQPPAG